MKLRVAFGLATMGAILGAMAAPLMAAPVEAGKAEKAVELAPDGLRFGLTLEGLSSHYSMYFDAIYQKVYAKTEPGPELDALDAEVSDKKALLKRSHLHFGNTPTGVDQSALKGEYSYGNGESMTRLRLGSQLTRNFFFFNNKLWKVYDEHDLSKGGNLGGTFDEAVAKLSEILGGKPTMLEPDFAKGRSFAEARWKTSDMLIRAVNREPVLGIVYSDLQIEENLDKRRVNRAQDPTALDSQVRSVTGGR